MKKIFSLALAACLSVAMFAETKVLTFDATVDKGDTAVTQPASLTKNGITLNVTKGSLANGSQFRVYKKQTLTITSTVGKMSKIVFNCTDDDTKQYGPGCFAAQTGYSYSGKIGTWEGSAETVSFEATSDQVRATTIVITYDAVAQAVEAPVFAPAEGAVTDNTFTKAFNLTISCTTEGATIKYTLDGTDPSLDAALTYSEPIEISATTTVRAIAIKGGDKSFESKVEYALVNTKETAFTVTEANDLIAADKGLSSKYYVKGTIKTITEISTSYGNATYVITDNVKDLTVYRGYGLDNTKFTSEDAIAVGGEVIVYGKLVNFNGTYEFTTGSYIVSYSAPTAIENTEVSAKAVKMYDAELGQVVIVRNGVKYNALGVEIAE